MYSKGHAGLTLLITSLIMIPFGYNENAIIVILLATAFSALPDIDMEWRKKTSFIHHRGVTHSILFAIITGIVWGGLLFYSYNTLLWFGIGFISAFLGISSHLIGDILTHHAFKPLWPFSQREVAWKLTTASNKAANEGLGTAGVLAFVFYILYTQGSLNSLLNLR